MKPSIRIELQHYPGYGTPPSWEVSAIYNNRLLERVQCYSEFQQGKIAAELKQKWGKEWGEKEFKKVVDSKPLASEWCSICGKDTLDGASSCVNKIFCKKCQHLIPQYQEEYRQDEAKRKQKYEAEAERERLKDNREVEEAIRGAFHWRDNWFWKRLPDGSVRIMKHVRSNYPQLRPDAPVISERQYLDPDMIIPAEEWASIVSSVSGSGETGETWKAALDFHNKKVRELTI